MIFEYDDRVRIIDQCFKHQIGNMDENHLEFINQDQFLAIVGNQISESVIMNIRQHNQDLNTQKISEILSISPTWKTFVSNRETLNALKVANIDIKLEQQGQKELTYKTVKHVLDKSTFTLTMISEPNNLSCLTLVHQVRKKKTPMKRE